MNTVVLRNAEIINEGRRFHADVLIRDGRIERIGAVPAGTRADQEYDLTGKFLVPGLIDDQVHFREPGLTHKACIASEARAAVAGGVTSFMEMPNTNPPAVTLEELEKKYAIGAATSVANYSFFLGTTSTNLEAIKAVDPRKVCGLKIFMGSSTGDMLVDRVAVLESVFRHSPTIILTHCEDTPRIKAAEAVAKAKWGEDVPAAEHPRLRDAEACYASSSLAAELARRHDARLHILHITTAKELALFSAAPLKGKRLTAEACVHHLWFSDADYARLGHQIKCNPAIKTAADRDAVRAAVASGVIDVIATDHAPHTWEEKSQTYFKAPSGLPLIQHPLLILMDLARQDTAPQSERLADAIVAALEEAGADLNSRPRRRAELAVLNAADFASVLVEVGFLSNPDDRAALSVQPGRATIIRGLVFALQRWAADEAARAPLLRQ